LEPSSPDPRLQTAWKADRWYLLAIAGGMLGGRADAEDVVQEAFTRLAAASIDDIEDVRGWLVVVTRRLCLDRLGSAGSRRTTTAANPTEDMGGIHAESVAGIVDPADRLTLDDEVRRALAVVIERLSPAERTSFILHDIFGFPFDAVAELVGRTPAACRQLARRARSSIRSGSLDTSSPPLVPQPGAATDLAERFITVCEGGDVRALIELLDPDATGRGTVIGLPPLPVVRGAEAAARRAMFFLGPSAGVSLEPLALEGAIGVVVRDGGEVVAVLRLDQRGGRIYHVHALSRPFRRAAP
jgi:RNA polymerase sigma-70 factor, ECF subfamily